MLPAIPYTPSPTPPRLMACASVACFPSPVGVALVDVEAFLQEPHDRDGIIHFRGGVQVDLVQDCRHRVTRTSETQKSHRHAPSAETRMLRLRWAEPLLCPGPFPCTLPRQTEDLFCSPLLAIGCPVHEAEIQSIVFSTEGGIQKRGLDDIIPPRNQAAF